MKEVLLFAPLTDKEIEAQRTRNLFKPHAGRTTIPPIKEASPRVKTGFVVLNSWDFLVSRMCSCKNPASGSEALCSASGIKKGPDTDY